MPPPDRAVRPPTLRAALRPAQRSPSLRAGPEPQVQPGKDHQQRRGSEPSDEIPRLQTEDVLGLEQAGVPAPSPGNEAAFGVADAVDPRRVRIDVHQPLRLCLRHDNRHAVHATLQGGQRDRLGRPLADGFDGGRRGRGGPSVAVTMCEQPRMRPVVDLVPRDHDQAGQPLGDDPCRQDERKPTVDAQHLPLVAHGKGCDTTLRPPIGSGRRCSGGRRAGPRGGGPPDRSVGTHAHGRDRFRPSATVHFIDMS